MNLDYITTCVKCGCIFDYRIKATKEEPECIDDIPYWYSSCPCCKEEYVLPKKELN